MRGDSKRASGLQAGATPFGPLLGVWAVLALGCTTAHVSPSDVAGPHGERFLQVSCSSGEACASLALKLCKGGYSVASSKGSAGIGDAISQLIECKPYVSNTAILGPHGETLIEIDCTGSVQTCFGFARKTCNGDYDIFMTSPFLIQCLQQSPPPEFPWTGGLPDAGPRPPPAAAGDAGPVGG